jgi:hypothetical protein
MASKSTMLALYSRRLGWIVLTPFKPAVYKQPAPNLLGTCCEFDCVARNPELPIAPNGRSNRHLACMIASATIPVDAEESKR